MKILVTGAAGFIGHHLCEALLKLKHTVVGLDNINDYYDVDLKYGRLAETGIARDKIAYNGMVPSTVSGALTLVSRRRQKNGLQSGCGIATTLIDPVPPLAMSAN